MSIDKFWGAEIVSWLVSPTDPFTTFELKNPLHAVPEQNKIRRSPDLEALKLWKGRSGGSIRSVVGMFIFRVIMISETIYVSSAEERGRALAECMLDTHALKKLQTLFFLFSFHSRTFQERKKKMNEWEISWSQIIHHSIARQQNRRLFQIYPF